MAHIFLRKFVGEIMEKKYLLITQALNQCYHFWRIKSGDTLPLMSHICKLTLCRELTIQHLFGNYSYALEKPSLDLSAMYGSKTDKERKYQISFYIKMDNYFCKQLIGWQSVFKVIIEIFCSP